MKTRIIGIGKIGRDLFSNLKLESINADCVLLGITSNELTHSYCRTHLIKYENNPTEGQFPTIRLLESTHKFLDSFSSAEQLIIVSGLMIHHSQFIPVITEKLKENHRKIILLLVEPYKSTENDRKAYQATILFFLKDFCNEQHLFCYEDVLLENDLSLAVNQLEMDIKESILEYLR